MIKRPLRRFFESGQVAAYSTSDAISVAIRLGMIWKTKRQVLYGLSQRKGVAAGDINGLHEILWHHFWQVLFARELSLFEQLYRHKLGLLLTHPD